MQSNKTSSRKPREAPADVAGQQPDANAAAPAAKARKRAASTSSKKASTVASAKRHRATTTAIGDVAISPINQAAQAEVGEATTAPKAMAMAAGSGTGTEFLHTDAVDSVGQMTEPQTIGAPNVPASEQALAAEPNTEEIAQLAHSYWMDRGYQHGAHEEDWLRAEQELKARR